MADRSPRRPRAVAEGSDTSPGSTAHAPLDQPAPADADELRAELDRLRAELTRVSGELQALAGRLPEDGPPTACGPAPGRASLGIGAAPAVGTADSGVVTPADGATGDRRAFLRRGTAVVASTAAAVVAATGLDAAPAAAANGGSIILGSQSNAASLATGIAVSGSDRGYGLGVTDNGLGAWPYGLKEGAIFGAARNQAFEAGVAGYGATYAAGVYGQSESGVAVQGEGGAIGVQGRAPTGSGVGVYGSGEWGVRAQGRRAALLLEPYPTPGGGPLAPPLRTNSHGAGEVEVSRVGDSGSALWFCAADGAPGTWRKLADPDTAGALHVLASPVRIYDSRPGNAPLGVAKGAIGSGQTRTIDAKQDGAVPAGATAVLVNLTIAETSANGWLALHRNGIPWPGTSTINWGAPNTVLANSALVALDDQARLATRCAAGATTHFLIDVVGYYR